jgi:hypothetical protein
MPRVIAAILVSFTLCSFASTCQAEQGRTVVILDATAQMAANLGQKRKFDWAKSGISSAARRMEPGNSFALWAFGTLPKKKCEDISELVPLQAAGGSLSTLDKALGALQPKAARAPAMDALQAALKSAAPDEGKPVSAVLVAGTGDDCIGDICGAAGRLHGLYPYAKLTVLGMSMSEQASANFTCAAKAMGGAFIGVKSGTDLERHLREAFGTAQTAAQPKAAGVTPANAGRVETAVNQAEAPAAAPALSPAEQPAEKDQSAEKEVEVAPPPQPEPNVVLSASLVSGMLPLEAGVTWEIYKIQITPTGQVRTAEAPLWVGGGGQAKAKLPEGRYSVKVTYGLATGSGEFTLGTEKVEKTVTLNAGTIVAEAQQAPNGPPVGDPFFIVSKPKSQAREELGRSSGAPALFHLNEGNYVLSAFAGDATLDASVKVVAGKVSVVRMPMNIGALEIKTFAKEGSSELVAAWHRLSPAASDSKNAALPVLRVFGHSNKLQLPAGSYRLESVYGNARVESIVTVKAGQLTSQDVILNAGEAQLSLPSGKSDKVCAVYEAGADRKGGPVGRAAGSDIRFILKAGRYEVECRRKGENAPAKPTEISVVAGQVLAAKIQE